MATLGLYQSRSTRTLAARILALLERAGPLTLAEVANRLGLSDEKELLEETLTELADGYVVKVPVRRNGSSNRIKVWSVVGDSRLLSLKPLPQVTYGGAMTLEAFRVAVRKRQAEGSQPG